MVCAIFLYAFMNLKEKIVFPCNGHIIHYTSSYDILCIISVWYQSSNGDMKCRQRSGSM